ncbi:hypothetical protein PG997_007612 [Apiospora hydei]|uniref:Uncharacterized protein n=1 Tax=Apiospora hydei TaxID=1337664 RepID=A0ABR1W8I3_9PEZI
MENPGGGGGGLRPLVRTSKLPCAPDVVAIAGCDVGVIDDDKDDAGVSKDDACSAATLYPETTLDEYATAAGTGEPGAASVGAIELLKKGLRSKRPLRGPRALNESFALPISGVFPVGSTNLRLSKPQGYREL